MATSVDHVLDGVFQGMPVAELLDASPAALKGLSAADAERLETAFNIRTIRDLAENVYFRRALAVLAAAGTPAFDPGPGPEWEQFLASAPIEYYMTHPAERFRLDFGPVYYRGRLDGTARVIVVGQDPSTNEILAHRIFAGRSGQRVQGFLHKLGLTRSYAMLNTFLFSVFGQFNTELRNISLEAEIINFRNAFLDRLVEENPIQAVIAFGSGARHAVENWPGKSSIPFFAVTHPAASDEAALLASWNEALTELRTIVTPDEDGVVTDTLYGTAFETEDEVTIPAFDLPFGVPDWHRTDGGHSHRDGNKQIVWTAP